VGADRSESASDFALHHHHDLLELSCASATVPKLAACVAAPRTPLARQATNIAPPPYELRHERLRLLRQRDRLLRKLDLPKNAFEAKLMLCASPPPTSRRSS
jgi:hypothetical protein